MLKQNNAFQNETTAIVLYYILPKTFEEAFLGPTVGEELKGNLCNWIFLLHVFSI